MRESPVVRSDPDILGGAPVFVAVPAQALIVIDYIEGGHACSGFLRGVRSIRLAEANA
jgi:hypothetical protein